jgi:hypothetical protein
MRQFEHGMGDHGGFLDTIKAIALYADFMPANCLKRFKFVL